VREPAPFVTRWRSRTVANGDSMTLLVRRCFQCSAGKLKNVSSAAVSFSRVVTAFGYLAPYSMANRYVASRACSRVSWLEPFRELVEDVAELVEPVPLLTFPWPHVSHRRQKPRAPSPTATTGGRIPRRFKSRSTVFQLSALSR